MYSVFKQVHGHTGIECNLYCNLYGGDEKTLLVSSANQLDAYRVFEPEGEGKAGLDHLQSFRLWGNVSCMQAIRFSGHSKDVIAMAFPDAKVSLVQYDEDIHDLKTLSINFFEDQEFVAAAPKGIFPPQIRVDPDSRCLAALLYGQIIAVIPLRYEVLRFFRPAGSVSHDALHSKAVAASDRAFYTIDLVRLPVPLVHVHDIQFLHGYFEPTLLILGEVHRSYVGRLAAHLDPCAVIALSLTADMDDTTAATEHRAIVPPVIWYFDSLPFDSFKLLPVPRPIGGSLLFTNNALVYFNQSVPMFGIAVNSIAERTTLLSVVKPSPMQPNLALTFDCCQATFFGPHDDRTILVSLSSGDLYVVSLAADSMRFMRSIHLDRAGSSVITTCITTCGSGYVFLGSRLGNSLLLHYKVTEPLSHGFSQPTSKRRRVDLSGQTDANDNSTNDDLDFLDDYDQDNGVDSSLASSIPSIFTFDVCASLTNLGPCGSSAIGFASGLCEEFSGAGAAKQDPELELAVTGGYGRNGAVCVLQRHIRPHIVTGFALPGCSDMWTVAVDHRPAGNTEPSMHSFLIISRTDSTLVLETGQEIAEVDDSRGFSTVFPTVLASSFGSGRFVLQVTTGSVLLLDGQKQLQALPVGDKSVVQAAAADPYAAALCTDGSIIIIELVQLTDAADLADYSGDACLKLKRLDIVHDATSVICFEDKSGLAALLGTITVSVKEEAVADAGIIPHRQPSKKDITASLSRAIEIDDEDVLLYGAPLEKPVERPKQECMRAAPLAIPSSGPQTYVGFVRVNGCLELYHLPDFVLAFRCPDFSNGNPVLRHIPSDEMADADDIAITAEDMKHQSIIVEVCIVNIHAARRQLYLAAATVNGRMLLYEAHRCDTYEAKFARVRQEIILSDIQKLKKTIHQVGTGRAAEMEAVDRILIRRPAYFRPFGSIGGETGTYAGIFVCGPNPHWLITSKTRPALRCHPMVVDGAVLCMAEFHNPNCSRGFVYFNSESEMRIASLSPHLDYSDIWPTRRIPIRSTIHALSFLPDFQLYVASFHEVTERLNKVVYLDNDERQTMTIERDARFVWPQQKQYAIQIFTGSNWDIIPGGRHDFEEWEVVTCMHVARLKTESGTQEYIAVGANFQYSEDVLVRGRIIIFEVVDVVPEPGQPLTRYRLKKLATRDEKGPVTSISTVSGNLMASIGQRAYMFTVKESEIVPLAFVDSRIYNVCSAGLKNYAILGDVQKGTTLVRFQEDLKILSLVARDYRSMPMMSLDFLVDNTQLGFICTDNEGNLLLLSHQPESRDSQGGQKLIPRADFNLGTRVNTFHRVQSRLTQSLRKDTRFVQQYQHRHVNYMPTLDGGVGLLLPIKEQLYRRLQMLQRLLQSALSHRGGLNPLAYRTYRSTYRPLYNPIRGIIDGDLVFEFISLSAQRQAELARRMGTSVEQLLADLSEVQAVTAHF